MVKLCLNTRDELLMVNLQDVVYFQANGNYTEYVYLQGEKHLVAFGITRMADAIKLCWPDGEPSPFARLGRSLIVNTRFLLEISLIRQRIVLGDSQGHSYQIKLSRPLLKKFKDVIYALQSGKVSRSDNPADKGHD